MTLTGAELDGQYQRFAPASDWATIDLPSDIGTRYLNRLRGLQNRLPTDVVRELERGSLRAVALNTGALEGVHRSDRGLTVTMIEQSAWRAALIQAGEAEIVPHVEASLDAYELVFDAATGRQPISEAWIRQLHEVALRNAGTYRAKTNVGWQDVPLPLGSYKRYANHVELPEGGFHVYAPVEEAPHEMARLVHEMQSDTFEALRPAVQAAFVHHCLTWIHPFADGNGRVARLLASTFLLRAASVPFMVYEDQQSDYLLALRQADNGRPQVFARFVFDRALDSMSYASELAEDRLHRIREDQEHSDQNDERDSDDRDEVVYPADRLGWIIDREVSGALEIDRGQVGQVSLVRQSSWGTLTEERPGLQEPAHLDAPLILVRRSWTRTVIWDDGSKSTAEEVEERSFEIWEPDSESAYDLVVLFCSRSFFEHETELASTVLDQFEVRTTDIDPEERSSFTERFRMWLLRQLRN
jgi:Fic family protein